MFGAKKQMREFLQSMPEARDKEKVPFLQLLIAGESEVEDKPFFKNALTPFFEVEGFHLCGTVACPNREHHWPITVWTSESGGKLRQVL